MLKVKVAFIVASIAWVLYQGAVIITHIMKGPF